MYLCEPRGTGSDIETDLSQERTNLSVGAYYSESPSPRTALGCPREISVEINIDELDSGVIISHGTAIDNGYQIEVSGGNIFCSEAGLLRVRAEIPSLGSGAHCLIVWTKRDNLITFSGAVSELLIYNYATLEYAFATAAHGYTYPSAAATLTLCCAFGGASPLDPTNLEMVRIGRRAVSTTESKEDHVAQSSAPAITGRHRVPMGVPKLSDEGSLAGPDYLLALAATRQADTRCVTALVNEVIGNPFQETNSYSPAWWFRLAPGSSVFHMCLRHIYPVVCAPKTNYANVRIHVSTLNAISPSICTIYFRMYSLAHLPVGQEDTPPPLKVYRTADATINVKTSVGQVIDLGPLKLAKEPDGSTDLILAWSFGLDSGSAFESSTGFKVNAVTVEPYYLEPDNGDIDDFVS